MDFGLTNALNYKEDWQTKRADSLTSLNALQSHRADLEKDLEQRQGYQARIAEMIDQFSQMDVLPEDQERVRTLEKNARAKIYDGLANSKGDLKSFMNTGGVNTLLEYKNSILNSKEVKQALMNKTNLGMYLNAVSSGKYVKPIQMESYETDPNTGEEVVTPKLIPFEEQYKMFREGKIDQLLYAGDEDPVKIGIEDFSTIMKDPLNPYSPDNIVSLSNVYEKAMSKGASHEQALDIMRRYKGIIDAGGDIWKWGAGNMAELNIKLEQLKQGWARIGLSQQEMELKAKQFVAQQEANQIGNQWQTALLQMKPGETRPLEPDMVKSGFVNFMLGLQKSTDEEVGNVPAGTKYQFVPGREAVFADGQKIDNATLNKGFVLGYGDYVSLPDGRVGIEAHMAFDDDVEAEGISKGYFWQGLSEKGEKNGFSYTPTAFSNGIYTGSVIVPIDKYYKDPSVVMGINKKRNLVGAKHEYTSSSISNADQLDMMGNAINESGMSPDQFMQGAIESNQY